MAVQKINILHVQFNRVFEDGSQPRRCRIKSVFSTQNHARMFLAEYNFNNCDGLVEVSISFDRLAEILDLDNDLGPYFQEFEVALNFDLGDIVHPPPLVSNMWHDLNMSRTLPLVLGNFEINMQPNVYSEQRNIHGDSMGLEIIPSVSMDSDFTQFMHVITQYLPLSNQSVVISEPIITSFYFPFDPAPDIGKGKEKSIV